MEVLRKQNERMTKQVADLTAENNRLAEPLKKALADVAEYKRQLTNYEKDKISLAVSTVEFSWSVKIICLYVNLEHQSKTGRNSKRTNRLKVDKRSFGVTFRKGKKFTTISENFSNLCF